MTNNNINEYKNISMVIKTVNYFLNFVIILLSKSLFYKIIQFLEKTKT